ncbi:MAG: transcription-repair coupling factor, partial [Gammaproteobacteria bacterium]|nr:transcription-repair coupling factor [Gammaproteobacteria bacterium]
MSTANLLASLPQLSAARDLLSWGNLQGAALPLMLSELLRQQQALYLLIVPDTPTALRIEQELSVFLGDSSLIHSFPDWETLPYDIFSPHQDIISQRLRTLYQLPHLTQGLVIVPVSTLMLRLCEHNHLQTQSLVLNKGQRLDLTTLKRQLTQVGYRAVDQVMEHGEFSVRGSLLDLYPMGSNLPYRIDFFDDEIDGLRTFDPDNQRTVAQVDSIELLPAHEFPLDKAAIERFRSRYREIFPARNEKESLYQQVSQGVLPAGIEYYLPLFAEKTESLLSFFQHQTVVLALGDIEAAAQRFWQDVDKRYQDRAIDLLRPILRPQQLYFTVDELFAELKPRPRIKLSRAQLPEKAGQANLPCQLLPDLTVNHQQTEPLANLKAFVLQQKQQHGRVLFMVESQGRRESLLQLVQKAGIRLPQVESWLDFATADHDIAIGIGALEQGVWLKDCGNIALISENELFGLKISQRRRRKHSQQVSSDTIIRNLAELSEGQPVVHLQHGIGRYQGLQVLDAAGITAEFVTIEYAGGSKLYVPVSS